MVNFSYMSAFWKIFQSFFTDKKDNDCKITFAYDKASVISNNQLVSGEINNIFQSSSKNLEIDENDR